jgi:hypothetical protein
MADINTIFVRGLLKIVHADVRKAFPEIKNVVQAASDTIRKRMDGTVVDRTYGIALGGGTQ